MQAVSQSGQRQCRRPDRGRRQHRHDPAAAASSSTLLAKHARADARSASDQDLLRPEAQLLGLSRSRGRDVVALGLARRPTPRFWCVGSRGERVAARRGSRSSCARSRRHAAGRRGSLIAVTSRSSSRRSARPNGRGTCRCWSSWTTRPAAPARSTLGFTALPGAPTRASRVSGSCCWNATRPWARDGGPSCCG